MTSPAHRTPWDMPSATSHLYVVGRPAEIRSGFSESVKMEKRLETMPVSGSTYPDGHGYYNRQLVNLGGLTEQPDTYSPATTSTEDPSARNGAVIEMMPHWEPINICVGGTMAIRDYSERIIPREPSEDDDAYNRRIFHATMPPFIQRLASQAAARSCVRCSPRGRRSGVLG